jgi:hypothetical protein
MEAEQDDQEKSDNYEPNYINQDTQYEKLFFASFLLIYGMVSVIYGKLCIPSRRGKSAFCFYGIPLWIMFVAMLIGVAYHISFIIDHSDQRNNEVKYRLFQKYSKFIGWSLVLIASFLQLIFRYNK